MKTLRFQAWLSVAIVALIAGVVVPSQALGAVCPDVSGKVVKVKTSYWLVKDGQRYEFVDSTAVQTWDRTAVTVKEDCVKDLPVVGAINYRPGSRLVKKAGETTVYAIGPNKVLHPVDKAAIRQWYPTTPVITLSADKFNKLGSTVDVSLSLDRLNDGVLVRAANKTQVYYLHNGQLVKVDGKLRPALNGRVLILPVKFFAKFTPSQNSSVKAADLITDPVTATVVIREVITPTTPPTTIPTTPVNPPSSTLEFIPGSKLPPPATPSSDNPNNTVESDLTKLPKIGANYTGPFPAPEGLVLEGTIGATKYFEPTGTGEYRFRPKIDGGRSINCLDSTRTVINSKGKNYDVGFMQGAAYGVRDGDVLFPKYNDTPRGSGNVGNKYYVEGFRAGYQRGYDNGNDWGAYYNCGLSAYKPGDYDVDGWKKTTDFKHAPNLKAVYYPGTTAGYGGGDGKAKEETYKWSINSASFDEKPEQAELNKGKAAVNLSEIQITEAVPEASEASLTPQDLAKMTYDTAVQQMNTKYKHICTVTEPSYETKTYGTNTVTSVVFVQICVENKDTVWIQQTHSFIKGNASGNMLIIAFANPRNLKKVGVNEFDDSKFASVPFLEQFLTKIQFN